jgi:hypothetical protein
MNDQKDLRSYLELCQRLGIRYLSLVPSEPVTPAAVPAEPSNPIEEKVTQAITTEAPPPSAPTTPPW